MAETTARLPRHIAVIMDGNGRWATQRGLNRLEGHRAGFKAIHDIVRYLGELECEYATFYAFSTENWSRPKTEVRGIFRLLSDSIKRETRELNENNVRIRWLGREEGLSPGLIKDIQEAVTLTSENPGMTLCLALNYGGRQEIVDAVKQIALEKVPPDKIDEKLVESHLCTKDVPDVDLLIRTAGEQRISNFLLWQSAYAEFYFTPVLWPDFSRAELDKALKAYGSRQRRFGGLDAG
jgi:undecaprenyl diphosphate synthase